MVGFINEATTAGCVGVSMAQKEHYWSKPKRKTEFKYMIIEGTVKLVRAEKKRIRLFGTRVQVI